MEERSGYRVTRFPRERGPVVDILAAASHQHTVHALLEVDVTAGRRRIREERLSFTAWVVRCIAEAAADHPELRSRRCGGRLVVFDHVDVGITVEREIDGRVLPLPHVLRRAELKTVRELSQEIRAAQSAPVENLGSLTGFGVITRLPSWLRRLAWRFASRSPRILARMGAPIAVTSVGMFAGRGAMWGIPLAPFTLMVAVGGIVERPQLVGGQLEAREYLCLTLSVDHDLMDGAPAARFVAALRRSFAADPLAGEERAVPRGNDTGDNAQHRSGHQENAG